MVGVEKGLVNKTSRIRLPELLFLILKYAMVRGESAKNNLAQTCEKHEIVNNLEQLFIRKKTVNIKFFFA